MSKTITRSHNRNLLLYHLVCPAKYRRKVFTKEVSNSLKNVCKRIGELYELIYIEIGLDEDHAHFLIQSVPPMDPTKIVRITKSLTARHLFKLHPEIKKQLWGGNFWTSGYYINTVGRQGNESVIKEYVRNQGKSYSQIHRQQLELFAT